MLARALACALALAALPPGAHAFGVSGFRGKLGYGVPEGRDGTPMVSGHLELERPGTRFHWLPNVSYWSADGASDLGANLDVYYHFAQEGLVTPYLGAGLGLHFIDRRPGDADADLGANLFGGLRFPTGRSHLFLEGRLAMTGIDHAAVLGGATFHR
jgi:hypothetical protein